MGRELDWCLNPHSNGASLLLSSFVLKEIILDRIISANAIKNKITLEVINSKIWK